MLTVPTKNVWIILQMGFDFQANATQVQKVKLLIAAMICQSLTMMMMTMMIMMMRMIMEMTTMRMIMMRRRRMTSDL